MVVPNVETLKEWATENNISGTLTVLCEDPVVKDFIMDDILRLGREARLSSFEQVRFVACTDFSLWDSSL